LRRVARPAPSAGCVVFWASARSRRLWTSRQAAAKCSVHQIGDPQDVARCPYKPNAVSQVFCGSTGPKMAGFSCHVVARSREAQPPLRPIVVSIDSRRVHHRRAQRRSRGAAPVVTQADKAGRESQNLLMENHVRGTAVRYPPQPHGRVAFRRARGDACQPRWLEWSPGL
jgi:hypothetical protein